MKPHYHYVFATKTHRRIERFSQVAKRWGGDSVLGFFMRDGRGTSTELGSGEICLSHRKKKYVHTDAVGLNDDMREKGHGIHLYFALIRAAKSIGAKRIYSARRLNKHSGNMWCNKLREVFNVIGPKQRICKCRCRNCTRQWGRYYIDLTKLKLKDIPV